MTDELPICELLGEPTLKAMVAAFYRRVRSDDVLGPMYPKDDWEGAEHRLATFLIYRFGGAQTYLQERGHPRLRMRHAPFAIDARARDRWLELMMAAIEEVGIEAQYRDYMERFLGDIATFLINRAS
ncbi:MAG: globin [Planctomycetota bacterium]